MIVRRVGFNKGDDFNPEIRSRRLAREIKVKGEKAIFAPMQLFESFRIAFSFAATQFPNEPQKVSGIATAQIDK